jgi:hypothetical protein
MSVCVAGWLVSRWGIAMVAMVGGRVTSSCAKARGLGCSAQWQLTVMLVG